MRTLVEIYGLCTTLVYEFSDVRIVPPFLLTLNMPPTWRRVVKLMSTTSLHLMSMVAIATEYCICCLVVCFCTLLIFCTLVVLKPLNSDDCDYKTSADSKFRYLFFIFFHFYFFL